MGSCSTDSSVEEQDELDDAHLNVHLPVLWPSLAGPGQAYIVDNF